MNRLLLIPFFLLFFSCITVYESVSFTGKNFTIHSETDTVFDPQFLQLVEPYKTAMGDELSEIIAWSDTSLLSFRPESPLSNFLSDRFLILGKDFCKEHSLDFQPNLSIMNHGGIRSSLPAGAITVKNIFELLPFENEMVFLKLSGNQLGELSHHIASRGGEGIAGMEFGILSGQAFNVKVAGQPLDSAGVYWLITNDYLANGGDGMKVLTLAMERIPAGIKLRDMALTALRKMKQSGQTIRANTDGRIYYVE